MPVIKCEKWMTFKTLVTCMPAVLKYTLQVNVTIRPTLRRLSFFLFSISTYFYLFFRPLSTPIPLLSFIICFSPLPLFLVALLILLSPLFFLVLRLLILLSFLLTPLLLTLPPTPPAWVSIAQSLYLLATG